MAPERYKLLAIDNDNDTLMRLRKLVQDHLPSSILVTASNGSDGINLAILENPDTILLDISSQEIDGYEICRSLKAEDQLNKIPVICVTSVDSSAQSRIDALNAGCDVFLTKPMEAPELIAQVRAMVRIKRANDIMGAKELELDSRAALNTSEVFNDESNSRKKMEQALKERDDLLTETGQMARVGGWELDAGTLCVKWTDETYNIHEVPFDYQPNLQEALSFFHQKDRPRLEIAVQEALDNGTPYDMEARFTTAKGKHLWIRTKCKPEVIGAKTVRLKGTFQDITERKQMLEALQNQIYFMESLIEAIPAPIFFKDTNHIYIGCNESYARFIGLSKDKILGKSVYDIAPKELSDVYRAQDEKLFENPGIQIYEHSVQSADGKLHDVIFHKSTYKDNSGQVAGLIGAMLDITALKRADRALRESEARYRQLADVTFEAIMFHDNGTLLHANKQFFEMFGYTFDELHGRQLVDILFAPECAESVKARIESASTEAYETVGVKKDGEEFPIEVRVRLRDVEGGQIRAAALRDLTQRKALEKQLAHSHKMEAIGTLAGGIAHDFNNILQIILGYAEMIQESDHCSPEIEAELQDIAKAAGSGAELVQRLLTFSRKTEFKFLNINLNERIEQLQKMLGRIIPKMISIEMELDDDIAPIMADPTQIEQILLNLAVNSRDAMPEGGKFIIETRNIELDEDYCKANIGAKPGKYALLSVTDTGVGADKETLEHIFEPFYTTKGVGEGTGLGLAMVYGIVKEHGGYIKCYSELSMGTTFKIYFPVIENLDNETLQREMSQIKGGQETILIIDDDEPIRALGKKVLGKAGYTIIEAVNGEEALEIYKENVKDISLVVLDLIMPNMGGVECLKKLLEINPNLKIIIASGFSMNGQGREALESGANAFLNKPFNMTDLLETVRKTLDD